MLDLIETERLRIRRYRTTDREDLLDALSRVETVRFEPYPPFTEATIGDEIDRRIRSDEFFAVEERVTLRVVGNIYWSPRDCGSYELGYVFHPKHWGKGYATEACQAVVTSGFAHGVHRVFAECDPLNEPSWRLLERMGFRREGHLIQNVYFQKDAQGNPLWKDTFLYAKLNRP